jgi:hypothetical protein
MSTKTKASKKGDYFTGVVMWSISVVVGLFIVVSLARLYTSQSNVARAADASKSIFEFDVEGIDEKDLSLSTFRGKKAYLVVNVASQCGLTNKNYAELQELYEKYQYVSSYKTIQTFKLLSII